MVSTSQLLRSLGLFLCLTQGAATGEVPEARASSILDCELFENPNRAVVFIFEGKVSNLRSSDFDFDLQVNFRLTYYIYL
jgi:hypothetical protein